ncbi:DUF4091 domain-containing protein [Bacteroides sedimenti]|uniref:DUF4091 domain-containing protein n=1 Tax=Bacteroides sedimenti TaxID=2136147 RepID=A0ABN6Z3V2_9BACE
MKRKLFLLLAYTLGTVSLCAQQGITQCGTLTGQKPFPLNEYKELPDPKSPDKKAWNIVSRPCVSWGSTDKRYAKGEVPTLKKQTQLKLSAWKGERVSAQAVVWSNKKINDLQYTFTEFKSNKGIALPASAFTGGFVRYVMTDELNKDKKGGCGHRPDHSKYDSLLVADPIDHLLSKMNLEEMNAQAIWVKCQVPSTTPSGIYKGALIVKGDNKQLARLELEIEVGNRTLPAPAEWAYHLDLWQSPFAVARYNQVPLWSKEHFDAMRPLMKMLADAGQKVITASIMEHPWNCQTEDCFESMVTWLKKADGTWYFDYTVLDKWVEFMMNLGINKQINCYSMVPWELSFQYFDQATNSVKYINAAPGEKEYDELWTAFLSSFSKHLKEKGWFDICTIAMDERPMEVMQKTLKVIRKSDPNWKVSLAGNYHAEIEPDIFDYCITISQSFPDKVLERRRQEHKYSTNYTCCTEPDPNTFTFSAPAESAWISYFSAKEGLDGYLRWAYNSWPLEPLLDSRFRSWAGGDTYLIYPGARSSIRFERMVEGIQAHEKITILRNEFKQKGDKAGLKKIEKILSSFNLNDFPNTPAAVTVEKACKAINSL